MENKLTLMILSCDSYSDLWDGHIKLLNQYWSSREIDTIIVTDKDTDRCLPNTRIIVAKEASEWSDRVEYALSYISTEYVLLTLDDYYLIKPVSNENIKNLISLLDHTDLDYIRLYKRPQRATKERIKGYSNYYYIDCTVKYSVNLYVGIWKKSFLEYVMKESLNAWRLEVSLPRKAIEYGANCAVSYGDDYCILDVVRKGKILHKANSYFRGHPGIYEGNRELQKRSYEFKISLRTGIARCLPLKTHKHIKKILNVFGLHYFSDEADQIQEKAKK